MTLKQFLDAAHVMLFDEYQRVGVDLLTAIEKTAQWGSGVRLEAVPQATRQNEAAMAALTGRLASTQGNPLAKKPRRA
jgi:hypothetical protein